ncbi:MAG: 2,3,4,5-tetrahydropyridine-2,6-dicarboxylate N-succinyltransferase [Deltaproteobacteria bacterium]|nr:2,3,4,5-tetrahydropyridine-2,6-dicarboxylate N-succinyltransferase [Deltaproteobacteria bacterium]MCB9788697.1 2,3,4,5-tetrahydropyridine-2,6-dicarboxylate N-succinyltransferase [Deltaproteobacteria bacterium]
MDQVRARIEAAFEDRSLLGRSEHADAVEAVIAALDAGQLRVASPPESPGGPWEVHGWVKKAVLLYFGLSQMETIEVGPFEYHDKIPLKRDYAAAGVRVVPPATVRRGAFVEAGAILMPSYVNIGARVGSGTMVDTWATVGSCAQIGRDVHLSGGVGIGGVLEPPSAAPVIIEDGAFIGSRCIVVEGVRVGAEAVLGAGVVLTSSTPILDVSAAQLTRSRGVVPPRAVVIPGSIPKEFPAGTFHVPAALIIGQRSASTDRKTSLEGALREFGVSV